MSLHVMVSLNVLAWWTAGSFELPTDPLDGLTVIFINMQNESVVAHESRGSASVNHSQFMNRLETGLSGCWQAKCRNDANCAEDMFQGSNKSYPQNPTAPNTVGWGMSMQICGLSSQGIHTYGVASMELFEFNVGLQWMTHGTWFTLDGWLSPEPAGQTVVLAPQPKWPKIPHSLPRQSSRLAMCYLLGVSICTCLRQFVSLCLILITISVRLYI